MAEWSAPWGGTVVGDAGPYSDDTWSDIWRVLYTRDRTIHGVLQYYWNELEVSTPGALTVRVAEGAALVDGKFYLNSAAVDFAIVAPGAGSNYYTVVLRKSWLGGAAQTVRANIVGPNAVAPPAVTQVDGNTWEISLATVRITNAGVITIADTRGFAVYSSAYPIAGRQGLTTDNTYWSSAGANDSVPSGNTIMQIGCRQGTVGAGDESVNIDITFPVPFSGEPFMTGSCRGTGAMNVGIKCHPNPEFESLVSGVSMRAWVGRLEGSAGAQNIVLNWIAIGPRA